MRAFVIAVVVAVLGLAAVVVLRGGKPTVESVATLPDIKLAGFQNAELPDSIQDDRGILLGGLGSGLFSVGHDEFWTITDRGPNGEPADDVRTFLVPEFTPTLVKVRLDGSAATVMTALPLTTPDGDPVTGLPPFVAKGDPKPALANGKPSNRLTNPNGLDTEGVVAMDDGFWVVEEYGPSIAHIDTQGHVTARYVPKGTGKLYRGADYDIVEALPADLAKRAANRGFEDVALLPDGSTIVAALQSPLDGKETSLTTKLVEFDTEAGTVEQVYNYTFDDPGTFTDDEDDKAKPKDLKISALTVADDGDLVVEERTDHEARFYRVSLGTDHDLAGNDKRLVANLAGIDRVPDKIEGASLVGPKTMVISTDNDFGFDTEGAYAKGADVKRTGATSEFVTIRVP
jgi:hypothetical protein